MLSKEKEASIIELQRRNSEDKQRLDEAAKRRIGEISQSA